MDELDLLDWKRRVFALYAAVRAEADPACGWELWRTTRDELFASHPQTPLTAEQRPHFSGLPYFDYDPGLRVLADVEPAERIHRDIATSGSKPYPFTRFAQARFALDGKELSLDLYWLDAYGGGIYLCFADATSGSESYHAGRYLLDTVKGSDLGEEGGRLVLDFNFAYNPSCSYDPRWVCPLAPPENRLEQAVRGGEKLAEF
jgi:uncharacterized protein (DUF1684 family)